MKMLLLAVLCCVLLFPSVAATLDITESELSFGSASHSKVADNGSSAVLSKTITLQSTSNYAEVQFEVVPENGLQSSNIEVLNLPSTLSPSTITVEVHLTIPNEFDAVNDDLEEERVDVGVLKIKGKEVTGSETSSTFTEAPVDLSLQVENEVSLAKVELDAGGSKRDITSSSTVEVQADQDIEFIFHVKNDFGNATNIDLKNIEVVMDADDLGEEEGSKATIKVGNTEEVGLELSLDESEEGEFDIMVQITATDELGGKHGMKHDFKLKVIPGPEKPRDTDGDGINDDSDGCQNTPTYCTVDGTGCPLDRDDDNICDNIDRVDNSKEKNEVNREKVEVEASSSSEKALQDTQQDSMDKEVIVDEENSSKNDASYFFPFAIGFIAGVVMTAGFWVLLKP